MDYGLKGKVAIITGGSDGIGKATAIALAREGAKVVICARGQEKLDQTAAQIRKEGGEVLAMKADVTSDADINRLFDETLKQYGGVDMLLNNAGLSQRGKFLEIDDKMWEIDLDIKVYGAIRCLRRAIPEMRKRGGGRIVNITISSAKQPGAGSMPTSLSRAAGLVITKALSKEYGKHGVYRQDQIRPARPAHQQQQNQRREVLRRKLERHPDGSLWRSGRSRQRDRVPDVLSRELRHRDLDQSGWWRIGRSVI
jgi:NAD(P)-dependent dehydrogenase (short-subunit alcohol dehydrogenase family)